MNIIKKAAGTLPLMALVAAFATSCSSDNLAEGTQQSAGNKEAKNLTLTATVEDEDASSRVSISKNGTTALFYWNTGDKIDVQVKNKSNQYVRWDFTTSNNGTTEATFYNNTDAEGKFFQSYGNYALYPHNVDHKFNTSDINKLTFRLPQEYTYTTVESNIFAKEGSYPTNSVNMPMLGKIEEGGKIKFKHLGGMAVIRIDKMPFTEGKLIVTSDSKICHDFTLNDVSTGTPEIQTSTSTQDYEKKVTFNFSGATLGNVGVFYLPLPTGDITNMKIAISDKSGDTSVTLKEIKKLTVTRAYITAIPVNSHYINGHLFVDLGLPSKALWANANIGAEKVADAGNFYAWGETDTKDSYSSSNYKFYKDNAYTKYTSTDKKTTLENSDDVASAKWGSPCHMPTEKEVEELISSDNTTKEWTTKTDSKGNSVGGVKITSSKNGNSIFLPAAGHLYGNKHEPTKNYSNYGYYWSNTYKTDKEATILSFNSTTLTPPTSTYWERYKGLLVRPVATEE